MQVGGSDVGRTFPILVKAGESFRRYVPNPNFILVPRAATDTPPPPPDEAEAASFYPILLGEVKPDVMETDRVKCCFSSQFALG